MLNPEIKDQLVALLNSCNVPTVAQERLFMDIEKGNPIYDGRKEILVRRNQELLQKLNDLLNREDLLVQKEELSTEEQLINLLEENRVSSLVYEPILRDLKAGVSVDEYINSLYTAMHSQVEPWMKAQDLIHKLQEEYGVVKTEETEDKVELSYVPFDTYQTLSDFEQEFHLDHSICLSMMSDMRLYHSITPASMVQIWELPQIQERILGSEQWTEEEKMELQKAFNEDLFHFIQRVSLSEELKDSEKLQVLRVKEEKKEKIEHQLEQQKQARVQTFEILKSSINDAEESLRKLYDVQVSPEVLHLMGVNYYALIQNIRHINNVYQSNLTEEEKQIYEQAERIVDQMYGYIECQYQMNKKFKLEMRTLYEVMNHPEKYDVQLDLDLKQVRSQIEEIATTLGVSSVDVLGMNATTLSKFLGTHRNAILDLPEKFKSLLRNDLYAQGNNEKIKEVDDLDAAACFSDFQVQEAYEQFCKIEIPLKKEKKEEQEEKEETFTFNSDHMNEVMAQYQIEVGQYKPIKLKEEDVKGIFKFFKKHRQKKEQQRVDKINQAAVDTAMDLAAKKIEQQYAENPQELQPVIDSLEKKYQAYIDRSEQYSKAYETKEKEDIVDNDQELEVKDENKDTRKIKFPEKAISIIKKARKKNELKDRKKYYRDMKTSDLPEEIEKLNADLKDLDKQSKHIQNQKMSYGIQVSALMEVLPKEMASKKLEKLSQQLNATIKKSTSSDEIKEAVESLKEKYQSMNMATFSNEIDHVSTDFIQTLEEEKRIEKLQKENKKLKNFTLEQYVKNTPFDKMSEDMKTSIKEEMKENVRLKKLVESKDRDHTFLEKPKEKKTKSSKKTEKNDLQEMKRLLDHVRSQGGDVQEFLEQLKVYYEAEEKVNQELEQQTKTK